MGAVVPPIFQNSIYVNTYKPDSTDPDKLRYTYSAVSNPTMEVAEKKIAALENGEAAICFASGMGAISACIFHVLEQNSHVIAVKNAYQPTRRFISALKRYGVSVSYITGDNIGEFEQAVQKNTKLIYLESPSTFRFYMQDLRAVAQLAQSKKIITIIDNSWATPLYQNPLEYGVDIVIHSVSKYLNGHSDLIGGVAIGKKELIYAIRDVERYDLGSNMDPHAAYMLTRGLRTLPIRMEYHSRSALTIAKFLEAHKKIDRVIYPALESHPQYDLGITQMKGYSSLFAFVPKGDTEEILSFVNALEYFQRGPSWGGYESLIAPIGIRMKEEDVTERGYPRNSIRIYVGLEDTDTLIKDLEQALSKISASTVAPASIF
jgi:cystathionine beta-lyase/cystathionine gamma-synthase